MFLLVSSGSPSKKSGTIEVEIYNPFSCMDLVIAKHTATVGKNQVHLS